ncbi:hypothetical protein NKJ87_19000 [Mesorhizobium sp. M0027]|uniref:hypothetical protein n=1 Tax=unclassified Mesorhizobium TaxID=325217 RepID=UPI0033384C74
MTDEIISPEPMRTPAGRYEFFASVVIFSVPGKPDLVFTADHLRAGETLQVEVRNAPDR